MIHIHSCSARLRKINCKCKTIGVILKTKDFRTFYEKKNVANGLDFEFDISQVGFELLEKMYSENTLYRSIGIVLDNFYSSEEEQLSLFDDKTKFIKNENLGKSIDKLEKKFGRNIVRTGFADKEVPFKQGFLTSPQEI